MQVENTNQEIQMLEANQAAAECNLEEAQFEEAAASTCFVATAPQVLSRPNWQECWSPCLEKKPVARRSAVTSKPHALRFTDDNTSNTSYPWEARWFMQEHSCTDPWPAPLGLDRELQSGLVQRLAALYLS